MPWEGFEKGKEIVKIVDPPISLKPGLIALLHKLGTGYDFPGLFGEGIRLVAREWFKRKIANPFNSPHEMVCSEAIAYCVQQCSYPNMKPDDWQRCTPGDVDDLLAGKTIEE